MGTQYLPGQCCKGVAVDCVGFVLGVLMDLSGETGFVRAEWPQDASMHDAKGSFKAMKVIAENFKPYKIIRDGFIEPGDVIVVGPHGGGPGHGMIVGARKNTIWHATGDGVQYTGISHLWLTDQRIFRIYRYLRKESWLLT